MNILFLTSDWAEEQQYPGGSGWYRAWLPAQALREHGGFGAACFRHLAVHHQTGELLGTNDGHSAVGGFDIVVITRWMLEEAPDVIRRARAGGQVVVQDVDDWYLGLDPRNRAFIATHPKYSPGNNRDHYLKALAASSAITVSTPYLAERYRKHLPGVPIHVVRNAIDLARWQPEKRRSRPGQKATIGWVGATPWRSGDVETLRGVLGPFVERHDLLLKHAGHLHGAPTFAEQAAVDPNRVELAYMAPIEDYPTLFRGIDIGLVPLSDQPFNRAKCLDASTRVATRRGVLPIGEVEVDDYVCASGWWRRVEAVRHEPASPGIELRTERGYTLRLTPEHRLFVNGMWTVAADIAVGDTVSLAAGAIGDHAQTQRLPWPSDGRTTREGQRDALAFMDNEDGPTVAITPRWGRIFGLLVGDGSVGQSTSVTFACDGQDADLIALLMDDLRAVGLLPGTETCTTWGGQVLRRRNVRVASAHFVRFLVAAGLAELGPGGGVKGKGRRRLVVPDVIWRSPEPVAAAFLAGLFEADGTVSRRGSGVSLTTKSARLAGEVQTLLTSFGIDSTVTGRPGGGQYHDRTYWKVSLRRAAVDVFAKRIRFLSQRKNALLDEVAGRPHSNAYRPMEWADRVAAVEPGWVEPVDLQVNGETFAAAGFLSHNSGIKGMEYVASGIPYVAAALPEYRWLADEHGIGRVAERARDWRRHLEALLDPAERAATVERERKELAAFDIAVRWVDWLNVYLDTL
jgi:hypothetical protein